MSSNEAVKAAWEAYNHNRHVEAAHIASTVLRAEPHNIVAQACLAMAESWIVGDTDKTVRILKKLVKKAPGLAMLYDHLGSIYAFRGEIEKAEHILSAGQALDPDDPFFFYSLTGVKKYKAFDAQCQRMRALYDQGAFSGSSLTSAMFGLAKVYDDIGDHEQAMDFYMRANAARGYSFAPLRHQHHLSAIKDLKRSGKFSALPDSGVTNSSPLFIVGMPRSGTSLAETVLGRHPLVRACGEMEQAGLIESRLAHKHPSLRQSRAPQVDALGLMTGAHLRVEAEGWLKHVDGMPGAPYERFTDKMPGNALKLGLIAKLFPNARIIYMRRNALDCCISNLFARFGPSHAYTTRQDWLGGYYRYVEEVVESWREIIDVPILDVHYEELVADPEVQTRRMLEFAGLEWDDTCLDVSKGHNEVRTASMWQARQPINKQSVDRWRRYEPWIQELIEALGGYEALGVEPGDGIVPKGK